MWRLQKPDPDPYVDPETAFFLTIVMYLGLVIWNITFPWWPLVPR